MAMSTPAVETSTPPENQKNRNKIHVFVTAHPDDESLFFLPTLYGLKQEQQLDANSPIWLLCLSTGNYDGLGVIRTRELQNVCERILQIPLLLVDQETDIPDHPTQSWPPDVTARIILQTLRDQVLRTTRTTKNDETTEFILYTFDEYGVSGHLNHCDTFRAVQYLFQNQTKLNHDNTFHVSQVWTLYSESNLLAKYIPVYSWWLLFWSLLLGTVGDDESKRHNNNSQKMVYRLHRPWWNWSAMVAHQSQFVWYRRLFVVFSCYTYVNVWQSLSTKSKET